jgi:hypothetical protein
MKKKPVNQMSTEITKQSDLEVGRWYACVVCDDAHTKEESEARATLAQYDGNGLFYDESEYANWLSFSQFDYFVLQN